MDGHCKAWQGSTAGLVIPTRAAILKVLAFHSANEDSIVSFYDLGHAPNNGEAAYERHLYGKGISELTIPLEGVVFERGIYVSPPASAVVTVFYKGV